MLNVRGVDTFRKVNQHRRRGGKFLSRKAKGYRGHWREYKSGRGLHIVCRKRPTYSGRN